MVAVASAAGCLLMGRWAIRQLAAAGCVQPLRYADCPALQSVQQTKQGIPTMGGVLVLVVAMTVAAAFAGLAHRTGWVLLLVVAGFGALGWVDDVTKLRAPNAAGLATKTKFVVALVLGAVAAWLLRGSPERYELVRIPWLARSLDLGWLWVPAAMAVIAGSAHAVNLTDGMDGLATGLLIVAFAALGAVAVMNGVIFGPSAARGAAIWSMSFAGACLGFLWFNAHPARVFLGDVGALALGAGLGTIALLVHGALGLVVIGGVFVAEAVSVMLQVGSYKWRNQRRIFRVAPLHHHVHLSGVPEPVVVVRFWIAGAFLAAVGLTTWVSP